MILDNEEILFVPRHRALTAPAELILHLYLLKQKQLCAS